MSGPSSPAGLHGGRVVDVLGEPVGTLAGQRRRVAADLGEPAPLELLAQPVAGQVAEQAVILSGRCREPSASQD